MAAGDFTGRVKFAWTQEKLIVLAEIEDNVLSDTHEDPQNNYWNDDCFEVFLDEDYSGGWHQTNYNAFAYHCAINEEDVIDSGDESHGNLHVNDHVEFDLDTIDATHYRWELAITIYDETFDPDNAVNTTIPLDHEKEMGIAVAYCDNDGGTERENFIGLVNVAAQHFNSAWQDASVFGKLTLNDPDFIENGVEISNGDNTHDINIFQDVNRNLIIETQEIIAQNIIISLFDLNGRLLNTSSAYLHDDIVFNMSDVKSGLYIVSLKGESLNVTKLVSVR